jgi:hypothetical protein
MVRVSARCNAIPLTKWFVAWKRSRPLRVWQYRLQGILSLATVALGRRECYKTEEPPISERPVSSFVANVVEPRFLCKRRAQLAGVCRTAKTSPSKVCMCRLGHVHVRH